MNYIDVAGGVPDPLEATVRQWLKTEKNRANIFSDTVQECAVAIVLSEGGGQYVAAKFPGINYPDKDYKD